MKFVIAQKHITKPEHAKDGKRHVRTLYYGGSISSPLGPITNWGYKRDAKEFETFTEGEANHFAKQFGNECYAVEVKG